MNSVIKRHFVFILFIIYVFCFVNCFFIRLWFLWFYLVLRAFEPFSIFLFYFLVLFFDFYLFFVLIFYFLFWFLFYFLVVFTFLICLFLSPLILYLGFFLFYHFRDFWGILRLD